MLEQGVAELAGAGGTALVTAMVTDGWEGIKARFAKLLGRGDAAEVDRTVVRLDECHALLAGLAGAELQRARAEQELAWRIRLGDLLDRYPDGESELRSLVAEAGILERGVVWQVEQHVTGSGHAQQAVQGLGFQVNTFGGQGESGSAGR